MLRILLALLLVLAPAGAGAGVVSAADPRAAEAGREILRAGGSAADAAIATMLALTVVEPQSSGIGGGGFLVHHAQATGTVSTIDGRETAPASARPDRFLGPDGKPIPFSRAFPGGLSVGVPGNIRLAELAHRRHGKLPWARLFQPAMRLAGEGFIVTPRLAGLLAGTERLWADFPEARRLYWQEGRPKRAGERVRNPQLARLLRDVARRGASAFYTGANGRAISRAVAASRVNKAVITPADLAGYRAIERPAVCSRYRAYRLCGMGPPSSGATTVFGILGQLERFDLPALGADDAQSWHLIGEAMRLAYADRDVYLADRDFVDVPVAGLLDPAYLRTRSALISPVRARGAYEPGTPPRAPQGAAALEDSEAGTSHFVAIDRQGNVASYTSTIEGIFGSQLIANGFFLNNELTDFSLAPERDGRPVANRVQAGKRPRSSMSPTIVYRGEQPVLALGSAGGPRIIMHVTKTLVGVLDWGLTAGQAIALPNLFFGGQGLLVEQGTPLAAKASELAQRGHLVVASDLGSKLNAAQRVGDRWVGAADPRGDGVALAE